MVVWDKICKPKSEGGLGLRRFCGLNKALLAKQIWRIYENKESIYSKVIKAKYGTGLNKEDLKWWFNPHSQIPQPANIKKVSDLTMQVYNWNKIKLHQNESFTSCMIIQQQKELLASLSQDMVKKTI